ncbi:exo-alpha-sialidase [Asanoa sp. NPDC049518]|uniref:exo-alpha-sialidase n=1 Tax=unclassified Asanoa TaxID=2685164 RepID=UPI00341AD292
MTSYAVAGDLDHLYVPVRDCRSQCVDLVAATADGGRTWTPAVMPGGGTNDSRFLLAAAGETVVAAVRGADAHGGRTAAYSTSTDAGRTWRPAPVAEVDELPADWVLVEVLRDRLVGLDPDTGDLASVALRVVEARVLATPTDRWVFGYTGRGPADQRGKQRFIGTSLAVSRDGGRTWSVRTLPKDDVFSDVTVANGKRAYAVSLRPEFGLWTSDDGLTWTTLGTPVLRL